MRWEKNVERAASTDLVHGGSEQEAAQEGMASEHPRGRQRRGVERGEGKTNTNSLPRRRGSEREKHKPQPNEAWPAT